MNAQDLQHIISSILDGESCPCATDLSAALSLPHPYTVGVCFGESVKAWYVELVNSDGSVTGSLVFCGQTDDKTEIAARAVSELWLNWYLQSGEG